MKLIFIIYFFFYVFSAFSQNQVVKDAKNHEVIIEENSLKKQLHPALLEKPEADFLKNHRTQIIENEELKADKFINNSSNGEGIENLDSNQNINSANKQNQSQAPLNKEIIRKTIEVKKHPETFAKSILAPSNDDICSATTLPVNGTCVTGQTNVDANVDYYGGCVSASINRTVWYTFTITGSNSMITITFATPGTLGGNSLGRGNEVSTMLMNGTCGVPIGLYAICGTLASTSFVFDNLVAGTYFFMVGTTNSNEGNFNICATQSVMPPGSQTGPEQDCPGALPLCSDSPPPFVGSYVGYGSSQDVSASTCLATQETNSMWYVFTPQTTGNFSFTIATTKDYDFALYDITTIGCAGIPTATPIRCNWSATAGNTGLTTTLSAATPPISVGGGGSPTMDGISAMPAGNTYALIIDNFSGDNTGFTISINTSPGYVTLADVAAPTMSTLVPSCTDNTLMLTMNEAVKCLSIQQNDFELRYDPTGVNTDVTSKISLISGYNCPTTSGASTKQIQITHDGTLATGPYRLIIKAGPSLADKCGNTITAGSSKDFDFLKNNLTLASTPSTVCYGSAVSLNADGADGKPSFITYTLNPGGSTNTTNGVFAGVIPTITTIYNVAVTFGGCTRTANATVTVEGNILTSISPANKTLCDATTTLLTASTSINGSACVGCTYVWSTTETTTSITVGAGTYTVSATSPTGCVNSNSPSSTVTLASSGGGGGSCDVLYVSPTGGGSGYTKDAPTTLSDAVTKAQCTNTIIKMQTGIYTLTQYQAIHSYATIEGGYNSGFTIKTSDMSGGSNSTTIRRTKDNGDTDNANKCSAFVVDNNADQFRIQDIRIELPGSASVTGHTAGANKTNYGIRVGTGCTNYNIVRCYVDAGVGSAP